MKTDWKRIILVIGIIVFVIILDFTSKDWATNTLMGRPVQSYLGDFFRLLYVRNEGAFLSLGSDLPPFFQFIVLKLFPVILLGALLFYTLFNKTLDRWHIIAFSSILGGGIANIYDRLQYGSVVDFMNMGFPGLRTGIFNIADVFIMIGLFMMLPQLFRGKQ
jgi:signal peptidase II